jgi:exodeoxyribonuclease VII small subunit
VSGARKAPSGPPASGPAGSPASPGTGAPTSAPAGAHSAAPQPQTYEAAAARVEEIIKRLDSGEASLNETLELVSEGKALIELCARQLAAVGDALEELRLDELVSRLESEASG